MWPGRRQPQIAVRRPAKARILTQAPTKSKFFRLDEPSRAVFLHEELRGQERLVVAQISAKGRTLKTILGENLIFGGVGNRIDLRTSDPRPKLGKG